MTHVEMIRQRNIERDRQLALQRLAVEEARAKVPCPARILKPGCGWSVSMLRNFVVIYKCEKERFNPWMERGFLQASLASAELRLGYHEKYQNTKNEYSVRFIFTEMFLPSIVVEFVPFEDSDGTLFNQFCSVVESCLESRYPFDEGTLIRVRNATTPARMCYGTWPVGVHDEMGPCILLYSAAGNHFASINAYDIDSEKCRDLLQTGLIDIKLWQTKHE